MKTFWIIYFTVAILGGISAIVLVGYPGDGRKGVDTVFGRMERGSPQIARGSR